jgi:hypothetical protein
MLKEISSKNADGGESSHRIIGVTRLQITLCDCDMKLGVILAADSIVYQVVRNLYTFIEFMLVWMYVLPKISLIARRALSQPGEVQK